MCLRCIVCLPTTLAVVVGILVIIMPTWVTMGGTVNFQALDPNNHYMGYPLYAYWIAGAALILLGFVIFCAASAIDSILCRVLLPLIVVIVLMVVVLPTVLRTEDLHDQANRAVQNLQQTYATTPMAKHTIDSMQQVFRCCGSDDPTGTNQPWRTWLQYGSCIPRSCSQSSNVLPSFSSNGNATDCLLTLGGVGINELIYAVRNFVPNSLGGSGNSLLSSVQSSIYTTSCTAKIMIIAWITIGFICAVLAMALVSFLGSVCCCRSGRK